MKPVYEHAGITLYRGDCLTVMPHLIEQGVNVDAVICDPPYGTTACGWDVVIPFDDMWRNIKALNKKHAPSVLFGSQPFTSLLVASNIKEFKYQWIWNKKLAGNGIIANVQPLKIHEDVCVFGDGAINYNPQMTQGVGRYKGGIKDKHGTFGGASSDVVWNDTYHPVSILEYSGAGMRNERRHPTQKPVALMRYLIRTYTNPGDTVLDFTCGSGTTLLAAKLEGRKCIGIERDTGKDGESLGYIDYTIQRLAQEVMPL